MKSSIRSNTVVSIFAGALLIAGSVSAATGSGTIHVVEAIQGGTAGAGDFTVTLTDIDGSNTSSISATGGSIAFTSLTPGNYTISQKGPAGYHAAFSGACAQNGSVVVTANANLTCTITDTFGTVSGGGTGGSTGGSGTGSGSGDNGRTRESLPPIPSPRPTGANPGR